MATIAPVIALAERRRVPQPPPDSSPETSSYLSVVYDMGLAEGERRAYAALGIRQPPRSRSAVLTLGPAS